MELIELAGALVRFRTEIPPGNEEGCARYVHDFLSDLHIEGAELRLDKFEAGRANLVARIGPGEPGLLFGGHMDVVPAGDESAWSSPPFDGVVKSGRLYGRGAADMKTGLAAILKAVEATSKGKMRRGLLFVATAGEEVGFDGLKALYARKLIPEGGAKLGIMGEPTGLRPIRAHKGLADFRITIQGRSGHASRPELGVNAIEKCAKVIEAISAWSFSLRKTPDRDLGSTIATPTVVKGGTKSNVIPDSCELIVDSRWVPGHGTAFVEKGLNSVIASLKRKDPVLDARVELMYDSPSLKLPKSHPAVRLAESVSGFKSEVAPYGTEAALYTQHGIPSIVLGPGHLKQAHVVDEFVEISEAKKALSIYTRMIESVCVA
ncbi:MAG TPA: ArgE/DapE family deacylase [Nitrososphaerales archaeon]|nr:ArgE/DapE family deacylase [Nitrososphaerales archaeon]